MIPGRGKEILQVTNNSIAFLNTDDISFFTISDDLFIFIRGDCGNVHSSLIQTVSIAKKVILYN